MLINLVKNALKFTFKGRILVKASFDVIHEMLTVHVVDTGKGILKEEQTRLFKAFEKLERTDSVNSEGIGMGLAICKKLTAQCGGRIEVHSDGENLGSTFIFQMKMEIPGLERPKLQVDADRQRRCRPSLHRAGDANVALPSSDRDGEHSPADYLQRYVN